MAESTLSVGYADLRRVIGRYLGIGTTTTSWTATEVATVTDIMSSALRQFYFPPPVGGMVPHEWSFLKPTLELDTIAPYDTGTIAVALAGTTVTLTDGVWSSWAATHGSLIVDNAEYVIDSRTDDTDIELADAWTETTETAAEYTLQHNGNYDLPDDFGGIEGKMVIESSNYNPDIILVGEGKIRSMRQQTPLSSSATVTPFYAAVRPKKHATTTTGQRFEIMFYPLPGAVYTISYTQRVNPQMLVSTTLEYPYGGAVHAETIRAACLAAAEEQQNGNRLNGSPVYDKKNLFAERLAASIQIDKQMNGIEYYGYNADNSDAVHRPYPSNTNERNRNRDTGLVTYNGNT